MNQGLKDKLSALPKEPGCYQMKNAQGDIIYIGKAKNLQSRVRSYFTGAHDAKTEHLVLNIADFDYIITANETEAFILEMNLIKKHQPKYNILLTDDKRYPYIRLVKDPTPQVFYSRDTSLPGEYFGPYPNAKAAKEIVKVLNKYYLFLDSDQTPEDFCLHYYLNEQLVPGLRKADPELVKGTYKEIKRVLEGKPERFIKLLEARMAAASADLNYEWALEIREILTNLRQISQQQNVEGYLASVDAFAFYAADDDISIQVFHWRDGKLLARDGRLYQLTGSPEELFTEYVARFYLEQNNPQPRTILISGGNLAELQTIFGKKVVLPQRGQKKALIDITAENAENQLAALRYKRRAHYERTLGALEALRTRLALPRLRRIEAFDNSHISGTNVVAAMVVWEADDFKKSAYRKYNLREGSQANDLASFEEVLRRRYTAQEPLPDLLLVDGGVLQVKTAEAVLAGLNVDLAVAGLVKDDRHRTRALVYRGQEIALGKRSGEFLLLERIQDEVHRFAIGHFHKKHAREAMLTPLLAIPGIGPKKALAIHKCLGEADFPAALRRLGLTAEQIKAVEELYGSD